MIASNKSDILARHASHPNTRAIIKFCLHGRHGYQRIAVQNMCVCMHVCHQLVASSLSSGYVYRHGAEVAIHVVALLRFEDVICVG